MNYSELKNILTQKKISIKDLAARIDMTEQGLHSAMKKDTLSVKKLELICKELEISPMRLMNDSSAASIANEPPGVYSLNSKIIDTQNKVIDLLTNELEECRARLKNNGAS